MSNDVRTLARIRTLLLRQCGGDVGLAAVAGEEQVVVHHGQGAIELARELRAQVVAQVTYTSASYVITNAMYKRTISYIHTHQTCSPA